MQKTPSANRLHIAIYGRRNAGKSTLINALSNQKLAIVSDVAGTTTDPVYKSMEILPIGPVVLIDTAGFDDEGALGALRIEKTKEVMKKTDLAILTLSAQEGVMEFDTQIIVMLLEKKIPIILAINKIDISQPTQEVMEKVARQNFPFVLISAEKAEGISELKRMIIEYSPKSFEEPTIVSDIVNSGEAAVLVIPIDTGMPKGRLILPQVQTMRDLLDGDAIMHISKERELKWLLSSLKVKPKLVITDSQAFAKVSADTPSDIMLTSFSILFARYKGNLLSLVKGAMAIKELKAGDKVLISEACTHHQQADDIGKVKIPRWIRQYVNSDVNFEFCSGREFPDNLKEYKVVIHCGGCMINRKEMLTRIEACEYHGTPIVNYGVTIALIHGILDRALQPFPEVYSIWKESRKETSLN
ncbi:MAG: [FeFe] hydrogenase H-cluster maturation GTPase HydF [Fusobacteria bacterium]|nr:[FeFe] hydrogenase H-cluster maturation GTPase HydF [Fusobacteriota bacterium]